jgi:pyruvate kinase
MPRPQSARKTRIVATLGPASNREPMLSRVLAAGVDVVRLNFSHGNHREHGETIRLVRTAAEKLGWPIAILQDLGGPKVRVGAIAGEVLPLRRGMTLVLDPSCQLGGEDTVGISLPALAQLVKPNNRILMDDGYIELRVRVIDGGRVICRVVRSGHDLREHKGVNLPGIDLKLPAVTAKDLDDLKFGMKQGVDIVALSFVSCAADVAEIKKVIRRRGGTQPVIAKIERPAALADLKGILGVAEGVMIARGDMAVELSPERVPVVQKRIIALATAYGKPVVTATQMLGSMVTSARPTRAEASDVANAILDGSDAVMLSEETAVGSYPVEAVRTIHRIAMTIERSGVVGPQLPALQEVGDVSRTIALGACQLADSLGVALLIAYTTTGASARFVSKCRPKTPILAASNREEVSRHLQLLYGVRSTVIPEVAHSDDLVTLTEGEAVRRGLVKKGDLVVFIFGQPFSKPGNTNSVRVHTVGGVD